MVAAWVLTIGMQTVRAEFNDVFSKRDHASDGSVGNLAHQLEAASGHNPDITGRAEWKDGDKLNEVRAIDVDDDLRDASGNGVTAEKVVQYLVQKARSGAYVPFRYIIYNRRIWSRSTGWKTQAYNGPSAHTEHIHFSGDYTQTADNWRGSLNLKSLTAPKEDDGMKLTDKINSAVYSGRTLFSFFADWYNERDWRVGDAKGKAPAPGSPVAKLYATPGNVDALRSQVATLSTKLDTLAAKIDALAKAPQ